MLPSYRIQTISAEEERAFMKKWHYSKKTVPNSAIRLGCFNGPELWGVATFGRIINCKDMFKTDPKNRRGLELNRLAMTDRAPKNSESWFLMMSIKLLKKHYPWLEYVHTWADGYHCEGGVIYKACGFHYLRKRAMDGIYRLPNGTLIHQIAFDKVYLKRYYLRLKNVKGRVEKVKAIFGPDVTEIRQGYQYHYLYLINKKLRGEMNFTPQPYEQKASPPPEHVSRSQSASAERSPEAGGTPPEEQAERPPQ